MNTRAPSQRALKLAPCAWVATLVLASGAAAHGGPPVIESSLAADDGGPFLVELSEGFALREGDGWSFLCPALFGADVPPPSAALGAEALFAGRTDLYRLGTSRAASAAGHPDLSSARVLSMTVLDGALLALRLRAADAEGNGGTEVVRLRDGAVETLYQDTEYWSSLAALPGSAGDPAQLWLSRRAGEGIETLGLVVDGTPIDRQLAVLPLQVVSIRLSVAGEHVFGHVVENGGYTLLHLATRGLPPFPADIVESAVLPIAGPALRGETILFTRDSELLEWTPQGAQASGSPIGTEPLTCLTGEHVCTTSGRLYDAGEVERAGSFAAAVPLLDLAQLAAPSLVPAAGELRDTCTLQWLVFRADLVRAGLMQNGGGGMSGTDAGPSDAGPNDAAAPEDADISSGAPDAMPPETARKSSGCSIQAARHLDRERWFAALAMMAVLIRVRTKRRTPC